MSYLFPISSVCGATSTLIDIYDAPFNPHGVICCDACKSIISARESWAVLYNYTFATIG